MSRRWAKAHPKAKSEDGPTRQHEAPKPVPKHKRQSKRK